MIALSHTALHTGSTDIALSKMYCPAYRQHELMGISRRADMTNIRRRYNILVYSTTVAAGALYTWIVAITNYNLEE